MVKKVKLTEPLALKEDLNIMLSSIAARMTDASKEGYQVQFNIVPDEAGVHSVSNLKVSKYQEW